MFRGMRRRRYFFELEMDKRIEESRVINKWVELISRHNASLEDTWVAMNEKDADGFTQLRHYIPDSVNEIVRQRGFQKLGTDIAVPIKAFREMMRSYYAALSGSGIEHVVFGHIGECHVHINLLPKTEEELSMSKDVCLAFIKKGVSLGGTVSAEHGVGKTKHKYLEIMYGKKGVMEMAKLKKAFDPNCILGLDNIFPREALGSV